MRKNYIFAKFVGIHAKVKKTTFWSPPFPTKNSASNVPLIYAFGKRATKQFFNFQSESSIIFILSNGWSKGGGEEVLKIEKCEKMTFFAKFLDLRVKNSDLFRKFLSFPSPIEDFGKFLGAEKYYVAYPQEEM